MLTPHHTFRVPSAAYPHHQHPDLQKRPPPTGRRLQAPPMHLHFQEVPPLCFRLSSWNPSVRPVFCRLTPNPLNQLIGVAVVSLVNHA